MEDSAPNYCPYCFVNGKALPVGVAALAKLAVQRLHDKSEEATEAGP